MSEKNRNQLMVLAAIGVVVLYMWTNQEDPEKKKQRLQREARERGDALRQRFRARVINIARDLTAYENMKKKG